MRNILQLKIFNLKTSISKNWIYFSKKNETIYDLSNKYGILPQAIKFNNLKKPYNLSNKEKFIYLIH